jgi:4-hydroxy-tetrahydrodipicolinate synthase
VQQEVGVGSTRVRPPRLEIAGEELAKSMKAIVEALKTRPQIKEIPFAAGVR